MCRPPETQSRTRSAGWRILAGIIEQVEQGLFGQHEIERYGRETGGDGGRHHFVRQQGRRPAQGGRYEVARLDELQTSWTDKAELALSKGREDLAKQALLEREADAAGD